MADDPRAEVVTSLLKLSSRVRHPDLTLEYFVPHSFDLEGDTEEERLAVVSAVELAAARVRRGSVIAAANQIIDECMSDLLGGVFDDEGLPDKEDVEDSFVYRAFPQRHRQAYDQGFFRNVLVTAIKVAQDIADPNGPPAACTAEEIIRQAVGRLATAICELVDLEDPAVHLDDALLEDVDFEILFDDDMDGIEDDPARQFAMGYEVSTVDNWFAPFNDDGYYIVHPYVETARVDSPAVPNLLDRVDDRGTGRAILNSAEIDSAKPLTGLGAASEVVELARRAALAEQTDLAVWVADETDPEGSFAKLVAASAEENGSGWLTWEPYVQADFIRTDPVVQLQPHRHFPVGEDQPWAWTGLGGGRLLGIPLDVIVSYRADPEVRQRWNSMFPESTSE